MTTESRSDAKILETNKSQKCHLRAKSNWLTNITPPTQTRTHTHMSMVAMIQRVRKNNSGYVDRHPMTYCNSLRSSVVPKLFVSACRRFPFTRMHKLSSRVQTSHQQIQPVVPCFPALCKKNTGMSHGSVFESCAGFKKNAP